MGEAGTSTEGEGDEPNKALKHRSSHSFGSLSHLHKNERKANESRKKGEGR